VAQELFQSGAREVGHVRAGFEAAVVGDEVDELCHGRPSVQDPGQRTCARRTAKQRDTLKDAQKQIKNSMAGDDGGSYVIVSYRMSGVTSEGRE
jgi:hypothetical protein